MHHTLHTLHTLPATRHWSLSTLLATCYLLLRLASSFLRRQELAKMAGAARWHLLPLHGELPAAEQSKVFAPPPRGQRKVPWLG